MTIRVEVVYALPERQWSIPLELPEGAIVRTALESAPVLAMLAEAGAELGPVGVWGRVVQPDHRLQDRDRVEIYRALAADPKTARRRRAGSMTRKPRG
jgi:putative ubiquitin-RnfH superfamily antitoxin RatB of RatAB toxin-antitoxin module